MKIKSFILSIFVASCILSLYHVASAHIRWGTEKIPSGSLVLPEKNHPLEIGIPVALHSLTGTKLRLNPSYIKGSSQVVSTSSPSPSPSHDKNAATQSSPTPSLTSSPSPLLQLIDIYPPDITVPLYGNVLEIGSFFTNLSINGESFNFRINTGAGFTAVTSVLCDHCDSVTKKYVTSKRGTVLGCFGANTFRLSRNSIAQKDSNLSQITSIGVVPNLLRSQPYQLDKISCTKCAWSDPSQCAIDIIFVNGNRAEGILVQDDITINELVTSRFVFGSLIRLTHGFMTHLTDGVLGLAYADSLSCNPTCIAPFLDTLVARNRSKDVFSICYRGHGGFLTLGGVHPKVNIKLDPNFDMSLSSTELIHVPLEQDYPRTIYKVRLSGIVKVGTHFINVPRKMKFAALDTSIPLIELSPYIYDKVTSIILHHYCEIPVLCSKSRKDELEWFEPYNCFPLALNEIRLLPTLSFKVDSFNSSFISIEPEVYMIPRIVNGVEMRCVGIGRIQKYEARNEDFQVLFGLLLFHKYGLIIDRMRNLSIFFDAGHCPHVAAGIYDQIGPTIVINNHLTIITMLMGVLMIVVLSFCFLFQRIEGRQDERMRLIR